MMSETSEVLVLNIIYQIKVFPMLVFILIKLIFTGHRKMEESVIFQAPDSGVPSHFQVQP